MVGAWVQTCAFPILRRGLSVKKKLWRGVWPYIFFLIFGLKNNELEWNIQHCDSRVPGRGIHESEKFPRVCDMNKNIHYLLGLSCTFDFVRPHLAYGGVKGVA